MVVLSGALMLLMLFNYHATYVSSMAYSSPSIVIDAGRTADGRRVMYDLSSPAPYAAPSSSPLARPPI